MFSGNDGQQIGFEAGSKAFSEGLKTTVSGFYWRNATSSMDMKNCDSLVKWPVFFSLSFAHLPKGIGTF